MESSFHYWECKSLLIFLLLPAETELCPILAGIAKRNSKENIRPSN